MRKRKEKPVTGNDKKVLDNIENFIWNPLKYKEEKR